MRIQHNIMAMNAYRNYMGNTNALAKNLEKLSSGYKINRAGDDAAGLAISEKMRAQIAGLDAAQKNVNDGISLVQTAEGAMQEIQDMLNRMVYLATQSANGTYDNTTDRANLQKEVDQLREEINRIADSANFNGIKLLDGTMDAGGAASVQTVGIEGVDGLTGDFMLPEVGTILGTDTVLHQDEGAIADATSFSVDLHNVKWDNTTADFELTVGDAKFTITKGAAADATGAKKAIYETAAITEPVAAEETFTVTVGGKSYDVVGATADEQGAAFVEKYNADATNTNFTVAYDDATDKFTFTQKVGGTGAAPTGTASNGETAAAGSVSSVTLTLSAAPANNDVISVGGEDYKFNGTTWEFQGDGDATYTVSGTTTSIAIATVGKDDGNNGTVAVSYTDDDGGGASITAGVTSGNATLAGGADEVKETFTSTAAFTASTTAGTPTTADMSYGGYTIDMAAAGKTTLDDQLAHFVSEYNTNQSATTGYTASVGDNGDTIVFTANTAGALGSTGAPAAAVTGADEVQAGADAGAGTTAGEEMTASDILNAIKNNGASVTVTGATWNDDGSIKIGDTSYNITVDDSRMTFTQVDGDEGTTDNPSKAVSVNIGTTDAATGVSGDYNVSTTVISKKGEAAGERLASTVFTLTEDHVADGASITIGKETYTFTTDAEKIASGGNYIDATGTLEETIQKLTDAAGDNSTYTVGNEGGGKISVTENKGQGDFDLSKAEEIAKSLGFTTVSALTGKGLTLQIGDTSDSYNQLTVSIGDMHVDSLGIGGIDISTQAGAQAAVDKIKAAINSVSMTRGTLGATQNRLEHTANNLSVMEENITNAESAIRDTDVAEEMMAYTKNNILIQSAQAMLAQANMVPQGVLQLLQ